MRHFLHKKVVESYHMTCNTPKKGV